MANAPSPLQPTWRGHISSTMDALTLFEACLEGRLNHVPRRPHDRERDELIRSGNVFIYEEHSSGIKRWTDGYNWSPSRILGNFLIYRELEKAFPPGEKKKAMKKKAKQHTNGITKPGEPSRPSSSSISVAASAVSVASDPQNESQRALIGSLVDSYPFKEEGLVKKTISVHWNGVPHHLVSYYKVEDVTSGALHPPSQELSLRGILPRSGLISSQNFRVPVDQDEFAVDSEGRWAPYQYSHSHSLAESGPHFGVVPYRSLSMPNVTMPIAAYAGNSYTVPATQLHPQLASVPSNVTVTNGLPSDGHYSPHGPTGHGYAYDPIRQGHPRHAMIPNPGLAPGEFPRSLGLEHHHQHHPHHQHHHHHQHEQPQQQPPQHEEGQEHHHHHARRPSLKYEPATLNPAAITSAADMSGMISPSISQELGLEEEGRSSWPPQYSDYGSAHQPPYISSPDHWTPNRGTAGALL